MKRRRGGMPPMLGYDLYTESRQGTTYQSLSGRDRCPPELNDIPMDSSSQKDMASEPEQLSVQRWEEHHGQLHDLDHGAWTASRKWEPTRDEPIDLQRTKDGTIKEVKSKKPREEYL